MKTHARIAMILLATFAFTATGISLIAQDDEKSEPKKVRRVRLPKFKEKEFENIFFDDVFSQLQGERTLGTRIVDNGGTGGNPADGGSPTQSATFDWSKLITSTTLEDEIKSLKLKVDTTVNTPSQFQGGGYGKARLHFSMVAALFGIIAEYDTEDVRWKKEAVLSRDLFAKVAANCKVGSQQAFNEAKLRKADLGDLVGGNGIQGQINDKDFSWGNVVDRAPLMQRLEISVEEVLAPFTADASEFEANIDEVLHEAELVAALSELLCKEGLEDAGDDFYEGFAKQMRDAAREIADAVKLNNHESASKAVGTIRQSCSECHENYRA